MEGFAEYNQSSRKRPPREFQKVVVTRAGRLQVYALVSDPMVKQWREVAYESFRNSLIIHKDKKKRRNNCLMSVFISDINFTFNLLGQTNH